MNKYFIILGLAVLIIAGGGIYRKYLIPESSIPYQSGKTVHYTVVAEKDEWRFAPEEIIIERGDKVILEVINKDEYDHGIAIDAFGVSQRMPAKATITVEFIVTQEGDFPYYCSVPCGEGIVNGVKRTHFDMIGKIKVKPAASPINQ